MADFVRAQGQLGDTGAPTTMLTVGGSKTYDHIDAIFFNTDTVPVEITLYLGSVAVANKIFNVTIPNPPGAGATVPVSIKQRIPATTTIIAEAESGKTNKVNYFITAIEV